MDLYESQHVLDHWDQNIADHGVSCVQNKTADEAAQEGPNAKVVAATDTVFIGNKAGYQSNNKDLRAGIAGANAAAGLPQAYIPGKSMVAVAAGTYKGQNAIALGMSRISDNGKVIIKLTGNTNSRGDFGASIGAGYQW